MEEWRIIDGTNGAYSVSSRGRVRTYLVRRNKLGKRGTYYVIGSQPRLKAFFRNRLYRSVRLEVNGKSIARTVHSLVAAAFIGPRPFGNVVRHLDCNADNNNLSNLAYGTHKQNAEDSIRVGTRKGGEHRYNAKLSGYMIRMAIECKKCGVTNRQLARAYGVNVDTLGEALLGKSYKAVHAANAGK